MINRSKLVSIGNAARQLGISIDTLRRWDKKGKLVAIRVTKTGRRYYKQSDLDFLLEKPFAAAKDWVSADKAGMPQDQNYCRTRDVFQTRLERMQSELKSILSVNQAALLTAVVGVIGNNSYDHNLGNWKDVMGIFFAYSLAEKVIVLADRGQGILKTLKRVRPNLLDHKEALTTAFIENISGRSPEKRGNGLKFVRKVVAQQKYTLKFQTGNALLKLEDGDGKIKVNTTNLTIRGCLVIISF